MNRKNESNKKAKTYLQSIIDKTNNKIEELGNYSFELVNILNEIQIVFDEIRNVPTENIIEYEKIKKIKLDWIEEVNKIENDYEEARKKSISNGEAGATLGLAIATLTPQAAMGVATTFGVASTGTAISTLSGVAARNAALAWLGGGALATGGGGMAAGQALIALAGPVGLAISGVSFALAGVKIYINGKNNKRLDTIFKLIETRDIKKYKLAMVEINERIEKISNVTPKLVEAIETIKTYGKDYNSMTEEQQYLLGSYVNFMSYSTQLLVNPIEGIQQYYTEKDFDYLWSYVKSKEPDNNKILYIEQHKNVVIYLTNLFYNIQIDEGDIKILTKAFKNNKELLETLDVSKNGFNEVYLKIALNALEVKRKLSEQD